MTDAVLSRREIEGMIASGRNIVIYDSKVLDMDPWIPHHPGGNLVVLHMVGRDATDEINVYHSAQTCALTRKFQIGKVAGPWHSFVPPIQGGSFRYHDEAVSIDSSSSSAASSDDEPDSRNMKKDSRHVAPPPVSPATDAYERAAVRRDMEKYPSLDTDTQAIITSRYRLLEAKLLREGYFQCSYYGYLLELIRYSILGSLSYIALANSWYLTSALFLGLFWYQITFTAHDAGHRAITHSYFWDNMIGTVIGNYFGGLSIGWWKWSHNVHHVVTNDPTHDPDIQHLPFFAVSTKLFGNVFSTYYGRLIEYDSVAKVMVTVQNWSYYPILCFGRFNLYRLSWEYIILGHGPTHAQASFFHWFEIVGTLVFWYWFGFKLLWQSLPNMYYRVAYVLVSHAVTMPLHVQFTLSHFAMSTADLGQAESFAQKMLRTTMDVDCPPWLDFVHGGLQFQAVHHLFPRMPRHNFRAAQAHVIQFCKDLDLPYTIYGFVEGNRQVLSKLEDVAKQASIFKDCLLSDHI